MKDYC